MDFTSGLMTYIHTVVRVSQCLSRKGRKQLFVNIFEMLFLYVHLYVCGAYAHVQVEAQVCVVHMFRWRPRCVCVCAHMCRICGYGVGLWLSGQTLAVAVVRVQFKWKNNIDNLRKCIISATHSLNSIVPAAPKGRFPEKREGKHLMDAWSKSDAEFTWILPKISVSKKKEEKL